MFLGSIMLFEEAPGFSFRVDWRIALTITLCTAAFFVFALGMAIKARVTRATTGSEGMIEKIGIATSTIAPYGTIKIGAEIWKAVSDEKIKKGERIQVVEVHGLEVKVKKIEK